MRSFLFISLLIGLGIQLSHAQGIGTWKTYLSYYNTTEVAEGANYVFAATNDGGVYSYGKDDNSIQFYSRQTGLSDNDTCKIGYNPDANALLIVYSNGNIDLLGEKGTYNLPYLKNSISIQNKTVNSIFFHKEYAYLSTEFGILVINMSKQEITDTYRLKRSTYASCIHGNYLYAATSDGVLRCALTDNLLDINNWTTYPIAPDGLQTQSIIRLCVFKDKLCFLVKNQGIYYEDADHTVKSLLKTNTLQSMFLANDRLIAWSGTTLYVCSSFGTPAFYDVKSLGTLRNVSTLRNDNTYWLATGTNGLVGIKTQGDRNYEVTAANLVSSDQSPKRNLYYFMASYQDKLYVAGGDRATDRKNLPGTLMIYDKEKWFNFDEQEVVKHENITARDYTGVAVDPRDPTHYFVSTYGEGLLEFKDNQIVELYNTNNSPLQTAVPSDKNHYVRIGGTSFDKDGNLWMNNCSVQDILKVLKADGTWMTLSVRDKLNNVNRLDKILITSWGDKWINIPNGDKNGLFVFNENNTLDDTSDDLYEYYSTFPNIQINGCYSLAEDKKGDIWIGTNRGLLICSNASARRAATDPSRMSCTPVVRNDENGTPIGYFLDGENVKAIAVDGGNRKWIGTETAGVFLVNEDGTETLENFTTDNSPLLSNEILSIAIDDATGEVFFGTRKGLISYMGGASQGAESYSDIYAYPNPVKPEFADRVTIVGLMADSNVKITDINGNLIYQAKSLGGQLTWDCRNAKGERVATGIYLVLAATPEAKESVVTKIMVIK